LHVEILDCPEALRGVVDKVAATIEALKPWRSKGAVSLQIGVCGQAWWTFEARSPRAYWSLLKWQGRAERALAGMLPTRAMPTTDDGPK